MTEWQHVNDPGYQGGCVYYPMLDPGSHYFSIDLPACEIRCAYCGRPEAEHPEKPEVSMGYDPKDWSRCGTGECDPLTATQWRITPGNHPVSC